MMNKAIDSYKRLLNKLVHTRLSNKESMNFLLKNSVSRQEGEKIIEDLCLMGYLSDSELLVDYLELYRRKGFSLRRIRYTLSRRFNHLQVEEGMSTFAENYEEIAASKWIKKARRIKPARSTASILSGLKRAGFRNSVIFDLIKPGSIKK
ncbi:hypothetical protein ACFL35_07535 [Candidatus Riflebacteria bacterium]